MTNGFYGNVGAQDEAWTWQSIVRQTAQGVAEDLAEPENTHGEREGGENRRRDGRVEQKTISVLPDSGLFSFL